MNQIYTKYRWKNIAQSICMLIFFLFSIIIAYFMSIKQIKGYSIFVEFSNGYGLKEGTIVTMRGINIGSIKSIKSNSNCITVLIHVDSVKLLIPQRCLIETNQVGLFSNTIIDIIPLGLLKESSVTNVLSESCFHSEFLCHNDYVKGYRGLNYDDLIRAATRISQRFDDPRFFNLLYLLIQSFIDVSDEMLFIMNHISYIMSLIIDFVEIYLFKYLC